MKTIKARRVLGRGDMLAEALAHRRSELRRSGPIRFQRISPDRLRTLSATVRQGLGDLGAEDVWQASSLTGSTAPQSPRPKTRRAGAVAPAITTPWRPASADRHKANQSQRTATGSPQ